MWALFHCLYENFLKKACMRECVLALLRRCNNAKWESWLWFPRTLLCSVKLCSCFTTRFTQSLCMQVLWVTFNIYFTLAVPNETPSYHSSKLHIPLLQFWCSQALILMRTKSKFWSRSRYVYLLGLGLSFIPSWKKNYFFESVLIINIYMYGIASKSARLVLLRRRRRW